MARLEDFIMQMKQLGELPNEIAAAAAPALELAAKANVDAGLDPYGNPWPPKKDGSRALKDASKAITVSSAGPTATIELTGVEGFHNGYEEGGAHPKRQMIPASGDELPEYLAAPLADVVAKTIAAKLGGVK